LITGVDKSVRVWGCSLLGHFLLWMIA